MKKSINGPVQIFRDEKYELKTRKELEDARTALQNVLNIWGELDLTPCDDLHSLIMNPQRYYTNAVNSLAIVPVQAGRFQVSKQKYIESLDIPIPDSLYRAAKICRSMAYCVYPELWSIENGTVTLNSDQAEGYIDSQSVYCNNQEVIALIDNLRKGCENLNKANAKLNGELLQPAPGLYQFCQGKFLLRQERYDSHFELSLDPEFLKRLVR